MTEVPAVLRATIRSQTGGRARNRSLGGFFCFECRFWRAGSRITRAGTTQFSFVVLYHHNIPAGDDYVCGVRA